MDKLPYMPKDIAQAMFECASYASIAAASTRFGSKGDSESATVMFNDYAEDFTTKASDLLSNSICEDIKWMFFNAAWAAANERKGGTLKTEAAQNKAIMKDKYNSIVSSNLVTKVLADNLQWMGWNLGWYWANTKSGNKGDAKGDKARYESHFDKIQGVANLISMKFFKDDAKDIKETPSVIALQEFINSGDIENEMAFEFSVTEGRTSSISNTGSFQISVETSIEVGFWGFGSARFGASFNVSSTKSISQSLSTGITKSYNFTLKVPAHETYSAKASVIEANMDVPYEMVVDIGGAEKTIKGMWRGVATTRATYEITKKTKETKEN